MTDLENEDESKDEEWAVVGKASEPAASAGIKDPGHDKIVQENRQYM